MERRELARFSPEFKDEAMRLVLESGRPIAQGRARARDKRRDAWQLGRAVSRRAPGVGGAVAAVGACAAGGAGA